VPPPCRYRRRPAGVLDLLGKDREPFLQGQCTNDVAALSPGGVLPAAVLTSRGKLVALFRVAKRPDRLRILLDRPAEAAGLVAHLCKYVLASPVELRDASPSLVRFDFHGRVPAAPPEGAVEIEEWPPSFEWSATWVVPAKAADRIERGLAGLAAPTSEREAEILRIEAGRPLWGRDMDESCLIDELGIEEAVSRTKGCYVGQEIVARMKTYGHVNRRLVGLTFSGDAAPAPGSILVRGEDPDREMGRVTSSVSSPRHGAIGLGYARREVADGEALLLSGDPSRTAVVGPRARA
jgi:folate-binding protein YgfZ